MFTYILGFPSLPSVSADLGLLDMVAGYFGYLGFSTSSQISLSFAKEITQWARAAVGRASEGQVQQGRAPFQGSTVSKGLTTDFEISYDVCVVCSLYFPPSPPLEGGTLTFRSLVI